MREVQLIELEILKEVARVCDANGIDYFLDSGTALGAFRHGGFIPWDDDIDIGMTRANYDKFLEIAPSQLGKEFFLQVRKKDKSSPYIYAKVRKHGTVFMEWSIRSIKMHHGIFVDIFPYDNVPEDEVKRARFLRKCQILHRIFMLRSIPDRSEKSAKSVKYSIIAALRRVLHWMSKIIPISLIENSVNSLFQKYNQTQTEYLACLTFGEIFVYKREDLFPVRDIKFEDQYFKCVNNMEQYLTKLYGDYLKLPPEDERGGHDIYRLKY